MTKISGAYMPRKKLDLGLQALYRICRNCAAKKYFENSLLFLFSKFLFSKGPIRDGG